MPKSKPKRATLASLAEELNVSRTTVSNAYNRPDQLSEDLRTRILETAKRLGYPGPDPVARSLRTRRAGAIGLLLTEELAFAVRDPAAAQFLSGLAEACGKHESGLTLIPASEVGDSNHAANVVHQASVDGFVIYSVAEEDPYLEAVIDRNIPTVVADQPADLPGIPTITVNDYSAMKKLADHLFDAGHKKVTILSIRLNPVRHNGPVSLDDAQNARMHVQANRISAVLDSAVSHGIDPNDILVLESFENNYSSGVQSAQEALAMRPETTALLCTSDVLALGAMQYAHGHNISVPNDLTITGFDGIPEALAQKFTTVVQPLKEKGLRAGELLFASENGPVQSEKLECVFQPGVTSAPPRH
ncbi:MULTISPECIES: LacI family DNA-binding transcriptional regulator [Lawsonella]|jgi:putative lacI family transcriptional regulator|uniref:LacI family transcriptional regulator n=1 Tax=Lawsonella clevelandensis TaxID=1528099 RepID=A0A2W5ID55_9ACTN|nr:MULTISPECIES: LacI family DNA-binding transcriptional regulator [Lawsonella]PZP88907.1 MAG: LacI family transcriptional regulator [Lawsonella clevelandensis]GHT87709.1 LacI family transcriptional regulator [Actinomycetota bacterium]